MRVCILTTSFPLYEGIAVGVHVVEQARHLVRNSVDVDVVAPHHLGALGYESIDGVDVHRFRYLRPAKWQTLCYGPGIPTNLRTSWRARLQLPFLILFMFIAALRIGRRCDIFQANWSIAGLAAVLAARLLGKRVVLVMYGAEIFVLRGNAVLKMLIRSADHVVAISEYTLEQTLKLQQPKAFSLIPPGIDVNRFRKVDNLDSVRSKLAVQGIDFDTPMVFALGKFIERKGFRYLIEAMAILQEKGPAQLMIGGRGPLEKALRQQVEDLAIAHRVVFLKYIPDELIPAYYTVADIFVSPSIVDDAGDTEGLGMVLLEALACQTPCVATCVGGIPDVIKDGCNGFLVEPANPVMLAEKLRCLIEDSELRHKFGINGRAYVTEHFSWKTKAQEFTDLYRQVNDSDAA